MKPSAYGAEQIEYAPFEGLRHTDDKAFYISCKCGYAVFKIGEGFCFCFGQFIFSFMVVISMIGKDSVEGD